MKSKRDDGSLFFGRSLVLLLVAMFVFTGGQMVLSELSGETGAVLGDLVSINTNSNNNSTNINNNSLNNVNSSNYTGTVLVTATVTATSEELPSVTPSEETSSVIPTATATSGEPSSVTPEESLSVFPITDMNTGTTTVTSSPSTGDAVRTILRQIGIPVKVTPRPKPVEEEITVTEEVVNERLAGEILAELQASVGEQIQKETRLRFQTSGDGVVLVAEVRSGRGLELPAEDVRKIIEALKAGSGLTVNKGEGEKLVFSRGERRAATGLPLLVDLESNILKVITSLGIRSVAILPDTAVANSMAFGALATIPPQEVSLVERDDGKIAYQISGLAKRKLFGWWSFDSGETVEVSAESGRILPELTDSLGKTLYNLLVPLAK